MLDLDPGSDVPGREVVSAAREVADAFSHLGLESWLKTTGEHALATDAAEDSPAAIRNVSHLGASKDARWRDH